MTSALPKNCLVRELDTTPLSTGAHATLKRARAFLFGVAVPARQAAMLLAGYTREIHRDGAYRTSILSGERAFTEWRHLRTQHPSRDPDLPEVVASLEAFADRWLDRARAATERLEDQEGGAEIAEFLGADRRGPPSRIWRAQSIVRRIEHMKEIPTPFYQRVWNELAAQSLEDELISFHRTLKTAQDWMSRAPVDDAELADMHRAREEAAGLVRAWLAARNAQLPHLDEIDRTVLGLGELEPPEGFDPPIALLAKFEPPSKA